jgi:two-component system sensor histidine kinase MprB
VAGGGPQVQVDVRADAVVEGDGAALERALANLVENARVHGPAGGRIRVAVDVRDGLAELSVEDDGPGLSVAEAERAVERFWRGEYAGGRPGSGLGLAIVRATAERHGGQLLVSGSRFTLRVPRVSGAR